MVFLRKFAFISLLSLFLGISLACQKKDPGEAHTYLIPWPNGAGQYKLQEVTLESLDTPYVMEGQAAKVFSNQGFDNGSLAGRAARPRLSKVDGVYVPQDVESSLVVTVYAHMENLKRMEDEYQLPTRISWPRTVGVGVPVRLTDGQSEFNNARYFINEDLIGITPFEGSGLNLALNAGILAHEHFHAIFEKLFMEPVYPKVRELDGEVEVFYENQIVMRAWNEGLADFFASIYTNDPDFMGDSISVETRRLRRLDGEIGTLQAPAQLQALMTMFNDSKECPKAFCVAYSEGTKLARTLYGIWTALPTKERADFLKEIISSLPRASRALTTEVNTQSLSLRSIVPYLVRSQRVDQARACKALGMLLGAEPTFRDNYPNCQRDPNP